MNKADSMLIPEYIYLPREISTYKTNDGYLHVAAEIGTVVFTNEIGNYLLEQLMSDPDVEKAFIKATEHFLNVYTEEIIYKNYIKLIGQIKIEQFLEDTVVYKPGFNQIEKGVHIYLTQKCNLSCIHCYNAVDNPLKEMSFDEFKDIIDFFAPYVISFNISGGEPMLSPYFFDLADYIKTKYPDKSLTLYTNATLITDHETASHIGRVFSEVQVSMDGATENTVDMVRGKGAYNKIIHALKLLSEENIEELAIAICLFKNNVDDLCDNLLGVLDQIDPKKRIKSIRFANIEEEGRASIELKYDEVESKEKLIKLQKQISNSGRRIWVRYEEIGFRNYFTFEKDKVKRLSTTCSFGQSMVLDCNGDLYPCAIKKEDALLGNIRDIDFRKSLLEKWEKCFTNHTVDNMDKCKRCDIRYLCCGECRLKHRKETGKYNTPFCDEEYKNSRISKIANEYQSSYSIDTYNLLKLDPTL